MKKTLLFCSLALASLNIAAQKFDNSFNGNGWVHENISPVTQSFYDVMVQPDKKVLGCGYYLDANNREQPFLTRYTSNGNKDNNFGVSGTVKLSFDAAGIYKTMIAQNISGQTYVASSRRDASGPFYLKRLNDNGAPDNNFGTAGLVTDSITTGTATEHVYAIAVQADGKILLAGSYYSYQPKTSGAWVKRYNTNGTPDTDFGTNGLVKIVGDGHVANRILIQPDGKILCGGKYRSTQQLKDDWLIFRLKTNGAPDSTFGALQTGVVVFGLQDIEQVTGMALQSDGSIILGGPCGNGTTAFRIVKLQKNGLGDVNFGTAHTSTGNWGYTKIELQTYTDHPVADLVVLPDDKIMMAGSVNNFKLCVFRFKPNGVPDSTYGKNSLVDSMFVPNSHACYRMALDNSSGRVYLAGWTYDADLGVSNSYIAAVKTGLVPTTGIASLTETDGIKIYPNPAHEMLNFTSLNNADFEIYSSTGQLVRKENDFSGNTIDVSAFTKGIYLIKAVAKDKIYTSRFIVE